MVPIKWVGLKPEQLRKVLGAAATPTAALAFEAPIDAHFFSITPLPLRTGVIFRPIDRTRFALGGRASHSQFSDRSEEITVMAHRSLPELVPSGQKGRF